mmetsp:Transcript_26521/g.39286  ORF Transcript_26521/g.39286 Transcript_26521/m.39286 type:complete len:131 (-) Transcript_26521:854-1246(-)
MKRIPWKYFYSNCARSFSPIGEWRDAHNVQHRALITTADTTIRCRTLDDGEMTTTNRSSTSLPIQLTFVLFKASLVAVFSSSGRRISVRCPTTFRKALDPYTYIKCSACDSSELTEIFSFCRLNLFYDAF